MSVNGNSIAREQLDVAVKTAIDLHLAAPERALADDVREAAQEVVKWEHGEKTPVQNEPRATESRSLGAHATPSSLAKIVRQALFPATRYDHP